MGFSDEFYTVPSIDIFRIFTSGFFLGMSTLLLIQLYYPKLKNLNNKEFIINDDSD